LGWEKSPIIVNGYKKQHRGQAFGPTRGGEDLFFVCASDAMPFFLCGNGRTTQGVGFFGAAWPVLLDDEPAGAEDTDIAVASSDLRTGQFDPDDFLALFHKERMSLIFGIVSDAGDFNGLAVDEAAEAVLDFVRLDAAGRLCGAAGVFRIQYGGRGEHDQRHPAPQPDMVEFSAVRIVGMAEFHAKQDCADDAEDGNTPAA